MDRLYERLTPAERFQIAVAAFGRGDLTEVDRLNDSAPWRTFKIQEPAYFDRLQRITWLALYFSVHARNLQITVLAAHSGIVLNLLQPDAEARDDDDTEAEDSKFDSLVDLCRQRIAHLKALQAAWEAFCTGLGVSIGDIDRMVGMPCMGALGQLEMIEEIVGKVLPDEDCSRERLADMRTFWKTNLDDRYAA
jgi:hypothetical protein